MKKLYEFTCDHEDMLVQLLCTIEDKLGLAEILVDVKKDLPEALAGTELTQMKRDWMAFVINDEEYDVGYPIELDSLPVPETDGGDYWVEIETEELAELINEPESYNLISFSNNHVYDDILLLQHEKEIGVLCFSLLISDWDSFIEKLAECSLLSAEEAENLKIS